MSARDDLLNAPFDGVVISPKVPRFGMIYDEKLGERVFRQIGIVDQQANIQSELASCDYTAIMQSLTSSLSDFDYDEFLDQVPKFDKADPMSLIAARENLQIAFQNLPKEVKAQYENNSRKFANDVIGGEFADMFASWQPDSQADKDNKTLVDGGGFSALEAKLDQLAVDLAGMRGERGQYLDAVEGSDCGDKGDQK